MSYLTSHKHPRNRSGYTYGQWLIQAHIGNGNGNLRTYNAWLRDVPPTTYKACTPNWDK